MKNVSPRDLVRSIHAAHKGETQLHPEIAKKLINELSNGPKQRLPQDLTEREVEVLTLIARGQGNREIAGELVISEKTVKTHVSNLLSKLHLADRTQAVIYALTEGLLSNG